MAEASWLSLRLSWGLQAKRVAATWCQNAQPLGWSSCLSLRSGTGRRRASVGRHSRRRLQQQGTPHWIFRAAQKASSSSVKSV